MVRSRTVAIAALLLSSSMALAAETTQDYADPGGAFAAQIPAAWKPTRQVLEGGVTFTALEPQGDDPAARVHVVTVKSDQPIPPENLAGVADMLLKLGAAAIEEEGVITSQTRSAAKFNGKDAVRVDLTIREQSGLVSRGYMLVTLGKTHAVLIAAGAPEKDAAGLQRANAVVASLAIESTKPNPAAGALAGGKGGLFNARTLAKTAAAIQTGKIEGDDTLLAAGSPALTVGSVRNFVNVIEECFDIHFNDAEFEATRERFIEYYGKADADGKKIIALGGAQLLENLHTGTNAERAAKRDDGRTTMARMIANGAKAGIAWAQVLDEAIQRRDAKLAAVQGAKPAVMGAAAAKTALTEASLDASMEMLYFMWVAAGRDAAQATPEAIALIRQGIQQNFARFPADYQYLFANAEAIYADLRKAWQQANPATQAAYGRQFGAALDSMGLTVTPPQRAAAARPKSAWDDVNPDDIHSGLVMNTCWNLAQKATH